MLTKVTYLFILLMFLSCDNKSIKETKEYSIFSEQIRKSLVDDMGYSYHELFNPATIYAHILKYFPDFRPADIAKLYILRAIKDRGKIMGTLIADEKGYFDFINFYKKNEKPRLIFRYVNADLSRFNYYEYRIQETKEGFKIIDVLNHSTGLWYSEEFKNNLLIAKASDPNASDWKNKYANSNLEALKKLQYINELLDMNEAEKADKLFDEIEPSLQKKKPFKLTQLSIKSQISEQQYLNVVEEYRSLFENDISLDIILLYYNYIKENKDDYLKNIENLRTRLGEDPLLYLFEAMYFKEINDWKNAEQKYNFILDNFPLITLPYYDLIEMYIEKKDFNSAINVLKELRSNTLYDPSELYKWISTYPDFIESKDYQKWKQEQLN